MTQPATGGRFVRDPKTGDLAPATDLTAALEAPAEAEPVPAETVEPSEPKTRKGAK